jgi:hypothetical protein
MWCTLLHLTHQSTRKLFCTFSYWNKVILMLSSAVFFFMKTAVQELNQSHYRLSVLFLFIFWSYCVRTKIFCLSYFLCIVCYRTAFFTLFHRPIDTMSVLDRSHSSTRILNRHLQVHETGIPWYSILRILYWCKPRWDDNTFFCLSV